jgi:hypothetical protein
MFPINFSTRRFRSALYNYFCKKQLNQHRVTTMKAKENIRIWFEFYKLALNNKNLSKEIEASKDYYKDWGNVKETTFDKWWNIHKTLFDEVTLREIQEVDNDPSAIYLKVPLGLPLTDLVSRFSKLISEKQSQTRKVETKKKTKAASVSQYSFTPGTEFRADRNYDVLLIYRDVYLKNGCPPINNRFIQKVKDFYEGRRSSKRNKLPIVFASFDPKDENDTIIRNCRRYIKSAERLMLAAAKGDFPGR